MAKDAPKYAPGYGVCVAFVGLAIVASTMYFLGVSWENKRRDRMEANGAYAHWSEDERMKMDDLNPDYRYFT